MQFGTARHRLSRDIGLCRSVTALHQALVNWDLSLAEIDHPWAEIDNLCDLTQLPAYGGAEPEDTSGVWSWDAHFLLAGSCVSDLRVVPRDDISHYVVCDRDGFPEEFDNLADAAGKMLDADWDCTVEVEYI